LYLLDILEASEAIQPFIEPVDQYGFLNDELRQSGVLQKLTVIGETAAHLPDDYKQCHPEIEWQDIIGFRNIAVHEYFAMMWQIVWETAMEDAPVLYARITEIVTTEFGG
jgi:uncharacterized protein with HEPN domain